MCSLVILLSSIMVIIIVDNSQYRMEYRYARNVALVDATRVLFLID